MVDGEQLKLIKLTNDKLGEFFGLGRTTIGSYKTSSKVEDRRKYKALKESFIKENKCKEGCKYV